VDDFGWFPESPFTLPESVFTFAESPQGALEFF